MSVPVHRSREAAPGDRGRAFGRAQAAAVGTAVRTYRRLFAAACDLDRAAVRAVGATVGSVLAERRPELADEVAGIAHGSGQDELELLAINARTEVLGRSGPPECSFAGLPRRGAGAVLAQNWDYHPDLRGARVVWVVHQPGGRWFATFTEAGILAKIGLTSTGLGVGLNLMHTTADGGAMAMPIHLLLRVLLAGCDDLDAALALLRATPVSASSCVTVGSAGGPDAGRPRVAAVELSPGGATVLEPEAGGIVLHTNHFVAPPRAGQDPNPVDSPDTVERLAELRRRVGAAAAGGADDPLAALLDVLRSHAGHPASICRHDDPSLAEADRAVTLASIVMDLTARRMLVADGAPCSARYEAVEIEPGAREAPPVAAP